MCGSELVYGGRRSPATTSCSTKPPPRSASLSPHALPRSVSGICKRALAALSLRAFPLSAYARFRCLAITSPLSAYARYLITGCALLVSAYARYLLSPYAHSRYLPRRDIRDLPTQAVPLSACVHFPRASSTRAVCITLRYAKLGANVGRGRF